MYAVYGTVCKSFISEVSEMKKLLALFLAAASALTIGSSAMAVETGVATVSKEQAVTFAFDTSSSLTYVHTFGNAADTNLTLTISDTGALAGRCLAMRESFGTDVSNQYGGFYIDAADLGLESFGGYTVTANVKVNKKVNKITESLLLFSDGEEWVTANIPTAYPDDYVKVSLTVPAGVRNSKVGISVPITTPYDDIVCYVDDISIKDNYGNLMPNVGDVDTSLAKAPNAGLSALSTILFIVLAIAIIGGVTYFIIDFKKKYR